MENQPLDPRKGHEKEIHNCPENAIMNRITYHGGSRINQQP
jgi:hypothetical protein